MIEKRTSNEHTLVVDPDIITSRINVPMILIVLDTRVNSLPLCRQKHIIMAIAMSETAVAEKTVAMAAYMKA